MHTSTAGPPASSTPSRISITVAAGWMGTGTGSGYRRTSRQDRWGQGPAVSAVAARPRLWPTAG